MRQRYEGDTERGSSATDAFRRSVRQTAGCSYAYDSQTGPPKTTDPGVAIAADKPDPANRLRNSPNHRNTGQNVLYLDGHVEWGPTRNVGLGHDDIFNAREMGKPLSYSDSYITQ